MSAQVSSVVLSRCYLSDFTPGVHKFKSHRASRSSVPVLVAHSLFLRTSQLQSQSTTGVKPREICIAWPGKSPRDAWRLCRLCRVCEAALSSALRAHALPDSKPYPSLAPRKHMIVRSRGWRGRHGHGPAARYRTLQAL